MANQTISGLNSITDPSSDGMLWISDPNDAPQDRSLTLSNFMAWLIARFNTTDAGFDVTGDLTVTGDVIASAGLQVLGTAGITAVGGIDTEGDGTLVRTKIIEIGDWNMDATTDVAVLHGLTLSKIIGVRVMVRNDDDTGHYTDGSNPSAGEISLWVSVVDSNTVNISRLTGGTFDSTSFNATSYNRGWIFLQYLP